MTSPTKAATPADTFPRSTPLTRITATSFGPNGAADDVIVSIDGADDVIDVNEIELAIAGKAVESRRLRIGVAVLSVMSLTPFFLLIIHLGSILQNSISAKKSSNKFLSSNFG
jgi:hypothetical protein